MIPGVYSSFLYEGKLIIDFRIFTSSFPLFNPLLSSCNTSVSYYFPCNICRFGHHLRHRRFWFQIRSKFWILPRCRSRLPLLRAVRTPLALRPPKRIIILDRLLQGIKWVARSPTLYQTQFWPVPETRKCHFQTSSHTIHRKCLHPRIRPQALILPILLVIQVKRICQILTPLEAQLNNTSNLHCSRLPSPLLLIRLLRLSAIIQTTQTIPIWKSIPLRNFNHTRSLHNTCRNPNLSTHNCFKVALLTQKVMDQIQTYPSLTSVLWQILL